MFDIAPTLVREPSTSPQDLGGLVALLKQAEVAFPLREVRVRAAIAGDCCRTVVEQVFDNPYEEALEAVHIFPLPPDGAVTELELHAGDTVVRAECRERENAEQVFEQARDMGRRAALLTAERADVHTLRVTNIPPATAVRVRLVVVQRLEQADGAFTWRFPTVIAPRYLAGTEAGHRDSGVLPDTDAVPDGSRLQPPLRLAGGTRLDLEVEIAGPLASIESSQHAVRTALGQVVRVAPSARATLDRDFVLRFAPALAAAASVRVCTDGQFTLATVYPPERPDAARVPRDLVLLVDVSGSMAGEKLQAAKRAVSAVLRGLERGDRFRLIAFESRVHAQTPGFLPFDQPSLEQADRFVEALEPMGGTEMLPALREAFSGHTPAGRLRTVIFITDGQAWNEQQLAAEVERRRAGALLFTVGIDTAVNESLLRRLAQIGQGTCELMTPSDDIEEAIVRLEARFGAPVVSGVAAAALEPARPQGLPLFAGRPLTILLRGTREDLRFKGTDASGKPVELVAPPAERVSFPLGALWAREHIAWLDDQIAIDPSREEPLKEKIVAIALEHHVASRFTAFVAVEEHGSNEGSRVTVVQPVELPAMWDESFKGSTMMQYGAAAPMIGADLTMLGASLEGDADESAPLIACERVAAPVPSRAWSPADVISGLASHLRAHRAPVPLKKAGPDVRRSTETALATSQDADGSYGGSVERTAAALVTLVRLGHTRQRGTRRRTVQKSAAWLALHASEVPARLALDILFRVEAGGDQPGRDEVADLLLAQPEGTLLEQALRSV